MFLENLSVLNFKNCEAAELSFSPSVNAFAGLNGAGKTNLLEALYYLSLTKGPFGLSDLQCVRQGDTFFMLRGEYSIGKDRREEVTCSYKRGVGKKLKRNGKEQERLSDHIGLLPVVMSSPADGQLISESGLERRRYMDAFLSQSDSSYLNDMMRYNALLAERNHLLKNPAGFDNVIDILDMQLCELGDKICKIRAAFATQLAPIVERYYELISMGREVVQITYSSALTQAPMADLLRSAGERDRILGHTTVGIHRDDLVMTIADMPIRKFGSQGQQKSMLIALRLAQSELISRNKGFKPLLLLDDVFDKLDQQRVENLLRVVSDENFGQIFITDSNKVRMDTILGDMRADHKLFDVSGGVFSER